MNGSQAQSVAVARVAGGRAPSAGWTLAMTVQALVLAGLLAFHYRHVLRFLVYTWSNNGDWSHGFIIPLFGIYYLYMQRDRLPRGVEYSALASRLAGATVLTAGFMISWGSTMLRIGYPRSVALVICIMGVVIMVCGWPIARWGWFAVAFLLFALPLPESLYQQITLPLRVIAARVSASILALLPDMITEPQGTVVQYIYGGRSGTLDIERACSGMRLMMTMSALGVAMAFVNERPLWQRLVMILCCVPIAVFCNIIRVTTTGLCVVFGREDLARGVWHTLLGLAMLAVAFSLYGAVSYVLSHLFVEAPSGDDRPEGTTTGVLTS